METCLTTISGTLLVASLLDGGNPVSYALFTTSDDSPDHILLWLIYTREPYRHKGHAQTVIKLLQENFDSIITHYETLNTEGSKLCLKCGFEAKKSLTKRGNNELVWRKE